MAIQKQIGYKQALRLEHKKIDMLINEIMNNAEQNKSKDKEAVKVDLKKWVMPKEPTGYIHTKKNDPL
ncbi:MAG TPA: hypothetical protein VKT28_11080 [Puia sp.]|nr:hypothetical protein [Puia sp.]